MQQLGGGIFYLDAQHVNRLIWTLFHGLIIRYIAWRIELCYGYDAISKACTAFMVMAVISEIGRRVFNLVAMSSTGTFHISCYHNKPALSHQVHGGRCIDYFPGENLVAQIIALFPSFSR